MQSFVSPPPSAETIALWEQQLANYVEAKNYAQVVALVRQFRSAPKESWSPLMRDVINIVLPDEEFSPDMVISPLPTNQATYATDAAQKVDAILDAQLGEFEAILAPMRTTQPKLAAELESRLLMTQEQQQELKNLAPEIKCGALKVAQASAIPAARIIREIQEERKPPEEVIGVSQDLWTYLSSTMSPQKAVNILITLRLPFFLASMLFRTVPIVLCALTLTPLAGANWSFIGVLSSGIAYQFLPAAAGAMVLAVLGAMLAQMNLGMYSMVLTSVFPGFAKFALSLLQRFTTSVGAVYNLVLTLWDLLNLAYNGTDWCKSGKILTFAGGLTLSCVWGMGWFIIQGLCYALNIPSASMLSVWGSALEKFTDTMPAADIIAGRTWNFLDYGSKVMAAGKFVDATGFDLGSVTGTLTSLWLRPA